MTTVVRRGGAVLDIALEVVALGIERHVVSLPIATLDTVPHAKAAVALRGNPGLVAMSGQPALPRPRTPLDRLLYCHRRPERHPESCSEAPRLQPTHAGTSLRSRAYPSSLPLIQTAPFPACRSQIPIFASTVFMPSRDSAHKARQKVNIFYSYSCTAYICLVYSCHGHPRLGVS